MIKPKKKKHTTFLLFENLSDLLPEFCQTYRDFTVTITNYSSKIETKDRKFLFTDGTGGAAPFIYHNQIKSQIGGEIRQYDRNFKYYDFSGIKPDQTFQDVFCVDINSAYLTVLRNEQIIDEKLYRDILKKTKDPRKKMDRLKAIGMFARNQIVINFKNGEKQDIDPPKRNPYAWVFFTACKKTSEAMEVVKKEMRKDFLFYWVDGIFLKGNPDRAVEILKNLNFESKIELVSEIECFDNSIVFVKDEKEKLLFLPKNQKEELIPLKELLNFKKI